MLAAARQALRAGRHAQAESLLREILRQAPQAWEVHHQLALLLATTQRPQEAARHFRLIVKANPTHAPGHANLATALAESGQYAEAIAEFKRALALDPALLGARIALGETLRRAGRLEEAAACFKGVLDADRVNHAAFNGLGLVYRDMEDLPRALECFEHAVGLAPQEADYRMNFAAALRRHKLLDLAAVQFYEAVKLRPEWLEAIVLLAEVLQEQRRFDETKECLDRALQLKPGDAELLERRGFVYLEMGDVDHALQGFDAVLAGHPTRPMALQGKGRAYMEAGKSAEAAVALERLIALHPDDARGYFHLAVSRKFKPEDPAIPRLKALVEKTGEEGPGAAALNFALGKIYDDCGLWDEAWQCYARANRLRNQKLSYSAEADAQRFDELIQTFDAEFMQSAQKLGVDARLPVIIVGMPRSGTTLTEQIISSHPKVLAAGEVMFWLQAYEAVPHLLKTEQPYPQCVSSLTPAHAQDIAARYLDVLRKIAGPGTDPTHITDKMPHNFVHLGLIATIFPHAPIIHCKRDAMDNCLSIFFQSFLDTHAYAFDLTNLGHHHRQYERLMAHWHTVLPGRIFDIQYEDLIADPEYWSRQLIAHVGLEWDDACLAPHKLERTVKTASHWQVRQPIYKTSVKRWKHYEKYLGPLKEALGYPETEKETQNT
jgi:tetratricopeptide (TPR) repeat protein